MYFWVIFTVMIAGKGGEKMRRRLYLFTTIFVLMLFLVGCSSSSSDNIQQEENQYNDEETINTDTAEEVEPSEIDYLTVDELTYGYYLKRGEKFYELNTCVKRGGTEDYRGSTTNDQGMRLYSSFNIVNDIDDINHFLPEDELVYASTSGVPPTSEKFHNSTLADYWVVPTTVHYNDEKNTLEVDFADLKNFSEDYDWPREFLLSSYVDEVNGISDFSQLNLFTINYDTRQKNIGRVAEFLVGEENERIDFSIYKGTQGMATKSLFASGRIMLNELDFEDTFTEIAYSSPNNGYVSLQLTELPPGYYIINDNIVIQWEI